MGVKNINIGCQKGRCTRSSMQNPFLGTTCTYGLWVIIIICDMTAEQNIKLDWRMCGLPTGGKPESSHFYSMYRGKFLFVSQVFSK